MKYEKMNFIKAKKLFYIFYSILIASSLSLKELDGPESRASVPEGKL